MAGRMDGKVAFVTGAARGQGRSHAVRLAQEGADIIAVDICRGFDASPADGATTDDLDVTAGMIKDAGGRVVTAEVDVRESCSWPPTKRVTSPASRCRWTPAAV
jgi:(+)-trans-carveol dehydrogenase